MVTQWAKDANGKSFPVEWRGSRNAKVNIDVGHTTEGPGVPHAGDEASGNGGIRGHILLDDVLVNR